jgi:hypothetical protein
LKNILRQNQVKNYSKLNKKNLLKKVNELIKSQNGGNSKKKYRLRGGSPKNSADTSAHPGPPPGPPPGYTAHPPYNPSAPPPYNPYAPPSGAPPFYSPPTGATAPPFDPHPTGATAPPFDPPPYNPSYLSPNAKKELDKNKFIMLQQKVGQESPQRLAFNAIRQNYGEEPTDPISSENDKSKKKNECEPCTIL